MKLARDQSETSLSRIREKPGHPAMTAVAGATAAVATLETIESAVVDEIKGSKPPVKRRKRMDGGRNFSLYFGFRSRKSSGKQKDNLS